MRVVAGSLKGRRLRVVRGGATRPTSDRVREALFSILGDRVVGARVLDLFAGTGALAIEALSRGAASAVLVEQAPQAIAVIRSNLEALDLQRVATVRRTRAETYLRTQRDGPFDLALLDPPYAIGVGMLAGLLGALERGALAPGAVVAVEAAARSEAPPWPAGLAPTEPRRYGDTALHLATLSSSPI
ncbi:MAG TPA: 16S rRNA (guanine(966)-N(2))-methyltransferase RsmD [Actinomycetes bacterium]|nr:16S rRNA (guanine(966)-N(2))-methyltransferase RsmD [Actinomycetes bacterium]